MTAFGNARLEGRETIERRDLTGAAARRPGTSLKDAGAYGKDLRATLPVKNPGTSPITLTLSMKAPPVGEDGAQLPGHQVYNGPVSLSAPGATLGKTVDVRVGLLVHANSQFPVDLVLPRTKK